MKSSFVVFAFLILACLARNYNVFPQKDWFGADVKHVDFESVCLISRHSTSPTLCSARSPSPPFFSFLISSSRSIK